MANNDSTVFNKNMTIIIMTIMMMMMTMIIIAMINNNNNDKFLKNLTPLFSGSSMFRHIFGKFGDNWLSWL